MEPPTELEIGSPFLRLLDPRAHQVAVHIRQYQLVDMPFNPDSCSDSPYDCLPRWNSRRCLEQEETLP
jgi:hypothetical protein